MDYKALYSWAPPNLLEETSMYTSCDIIVALRKNERKFAKENDRSVRIIPCREDEPVCCDESSDPEGPFCYFYATVFKRILLRLPLFNFEKELLTEINVAPAQLHPNNWAFVRGIIILYTLGLLPSVEVFLYFFEAKHLRRQLWVSFNEVSGRALLLLLQQSYKGFKTKFLKIRCNKRDPTLLDGFPLYWTENPRFQGVRYLEDLSQFDQEVCQFLSSLKVVFETAFLISREFTPRALKASIGTLHSLLLRLTLLLLLTTSCPLLQIVCWRRLTRKSWRREPRGSGQLLKHLRFLSSKLQPLLFHPLLKMVR